MICIPFASPSHLRVFAFSPEWKSAGVQTLDAADRTATIKPLFPE
jgi:hypothetical protein